MTLIRELFTRTDRIKLIIGAAGSVVVSFVETGAILLLVPLMSLLSGGADTGGAIGHIDALFGNPPQDTLILILTGFVLAAFILKDASTLAFRWWLLGFTARMQVRTSTRLYGALLRAPYALHTGRTLADNIRTVGDAVAQFYGRTVSSGLSIFSEAITIATISIGIFLIMPVPTLLVVAYFATASLIFSKTIRPAAVASGKQLLEATGMSYEWLVRGMRGIQEIKIRHAYKHYIDNYRKWSWEAGSAARTASFLNEAPKYLLEILFILGLGGLILGTTLTGQAQSLFGTLAVLAAAAFRILPATTRLLSSFTNLKSGESARTHLYNEIQREKNYQLSAIEPATQSLPLTKSVVFDNVHFTYPGGSRPVLRGINLTIEAGSSVGIVGGSGAGKTTLANLLLGLFEPTQGKITVDGVDAHSHIAEWQNVLAFVPQDVWLMDSTLAENIAFDQSPEEIDQTRLERAIAQSQLSDLVSSVFGGAHTRFGEHGSRLSGGQKQRVGIARAIYRDPSLLVLDEATSSLDNETERRVTDTIANLRGEMTIMIIAHRLSTLKDVDQIVLLNNGTVEDQGSFQELVARNQNFAHLVELGRLDEDVRTEATTHGSTAETPENPAIP